MLVTRPEPDASETAARLGALGITPVIASLLVHETLASTLPDPAGFSALALTSANALRALADRGALERYRHLTVYCIGDRTAASATAQGFPDVHSAAGSFAELTGMLAHAPVSGPILYPAARDRSADLARSLAPFGRMVITVPVYAMVGTSRLPDGVETGLATGQIAAALFYSRRTAATFVSLMSDALDRSARSRPVMLCLSEAVAEPLINAHFVRIGLADHPSEEAMMGLALSLSRDQNAH
jgi:uroporphyrinogen-III synthase